MPGDDKGRSITELLATVVANVAAVPVVVGFVALGGLLVAGRALLDVALRSRDGRASQRKKRTRRERSATEPR